MFVLFARWKGAKITTEHGMHILRTYRVSLASLRLNQVSCLMVVCIDWIIADCVGAIQKLFGFPARILYGRPTHMEVYRATLTFLGD